VSLTIQKVDSELYKQNYQSIANRVSEAYLRIEIVMFAFFGLTLAEIGKRLLSAANRMTPMSFARSRPGSAGRSPLRPC
jgi:Na+/citrate or Na+/malate symporter